MNPNALFAAAGQIQQCCVDHGWAFCFIGGLAVLRWGDPRLTRDVDLTIVTGFGDEEPVIRALTQRFPERIEDAAAFARENRVLLIQSESVPIDVSLGALPFEQRATERATPFGIGPGEALRTCSAEDLIVLKAFAGRDRDWADIEGVALRQAGALDETLIWEELLPLLHIKGDEEAAERLRHVLST